MGQHSHVVLRNLRLLHRSGICPVELTPGRPWTAVGGSWRPWSAVDGHGRPTLPYAPPPPAPSLLCSGAGLFHIFLRRKTASMMIIPGSHRFLFNPKLLAPCSWPNENVPAFGFYYLR